MKRKLIYLIVVSAVIRILAASFTELGNDEVYYRILALFPDLGYFDHPPMVAWLAGLTTLWSTTTCELLVRLGPIIIGCINTWLIYILTKKMGGSDRAGYISALLCTGSIYMSVICGTFIMPDTPLTMFWLISLILLIDVFKNQSRKSLILFGFTVGLATLSKYTGGELWLGAVLYILIFERKWLKSPYLYISVLISVICFSPVILWNIQNDFITFTFHGERITGGSKIELYLFFRELLGEFYYNNPINWVLTLLAVISFFRATKTGRTNQNTADITINSEKPVFVAKSWFYLLLCIAGPMIFLFLTVSLTKETLPHWSAPAYLTLMPLAALYLDSRKESAIKWGYIASGLILFTLIAGVIQVNIGIVNIPDDRGPWRLGSSDFSLDMYGWRQGAQKFDSIVSQDTIMPKDAKLIQYGWDDAAHIDCYFALPYGHKVMTLGEPGSVHYWDWITKKRGAFRCGEDVWLITSSRYPKKPEEFYVEDFEEIYPADTLKIYRTGTHVMNFYAYRLKGLKASSEKAIFRK